MRNNEYKKMWVYEIDDSFSHKQYDERLNKLIPGERRDMVLAEILAVYPNWTGFLKLEHVNCLKERRAIAPEICLLGDNLKYHILPEGSVVLAGDFGYEHCFKTIPMPPNPAEENC